MILHPKTIEDFLKLTAEGECLVDFYATWCGPCKMIAPNLEELDYMNALGDVKIVKVDIDELPLLAQKFNIQAVPTLLYMKDGSIKKTQLGFMSKQQITSFVDK